MNTFIPAWMIVEDMIKAKSALDSSSKIMGRMETMASRSQELTEELERVFPDKDSCHLTLTMRRVELHCRLRDYDAALHTLEVVIPAGSADILFNSIIRAGNLRQNSLMK
eukprot:Lankesteria_metandrocarpae@DN7225_c0_g1_i1.p2